MRVVWVVAVACAAVLLAAPIAAAAPDRTPRDFFGVMVDGPMLEPGFDWDSEARMIRGTGIVTTRMAFNWFEMAPRRDVREWSKYDRRIGALAHQGVRVMPVLIRAPAWAANGNGLPNAVPQARLFEEFVREVVARYGHNGRFWRENPAIPYRPVKYWQIWNEPDHGEFWDYSPWPEKFLVVLRAGSRAVRTTDRRALVVAPGVTNKPFESLFQLYEAGAKGLFDVAAIHPYRATPKLVMSVVRRTREMMDRRGDRKVPIMLSEMTFSSGRGHARLGNGLETTERGQARLLRRLMRLLARDRRRFNIAQAYWYTWMSGPLGQDRTWFYSGVRRWEGADRPLVDKPALAALRGVIRRTTGLR